MSKIVIPKQPQHVEFRIDRLWNGEDCADEQCHARVRLSQTDRGLVIEAESAIRADRKVPAAPTDRPLEGLWEYDVVEVFVVGENGHYLEVELGAGGHWLVLGFDGVRHRSNSYADVQLECHFETGEKVWKSQIVIPWDMVPHPVARLNAYAICSGQFLAYSPVPGAVADYHQPTVFPEAELGG